MKKLILFLIPVITLFACNQKELESLRTENSELRAEAAEKDSSLVSFIEAFNEIEENLAEIRQRELNISLQSAESGRTNKQVQEQIKEDIKVINDLIAQNRQKIEDLNSQLQNSNSKNVRLNRMMIEMKNNLIQQTEEKDQQIAVLKEDLQNINFTVEELNADLDTLQKKNEMLAFEKEEKETQLEEKINSLNTAYIALGTKKELEEENIIQKEGGFLGIGKTEKLNDELNVSAFREVDIRKTLSIPVTGKKVELVTPHPAESYRLIGEEEVEKIEIVNPEKFWNNSKYLVVRVN